MRTLCYSGDQYAELQHCGWAEWCRIHELSIPAKRGVAVQLAPYQAELNIKQYAELVSNHTMLVNKTSDCIHMMLVNKTSDCIRMMLGNKTSGHITQCLSNVDILIKVKQPTGDIVGSCA